MVTVLALAMKGLDGFLHDPRRAKPHVEELRLQRDVSESLLDEHADLLKGFILAHNGYGFASRVLYDAAGLALCRTYSVPVMLRVCDARFLVIYVRTNPSSPLTVVVEDTPSLRQLLHQRIQQLMSTADADEADDEGNTLFHLAARAKLWEVMVMADLRSLLTVNKRNESPIDLIRSVVDQQSSTGCTDLAASDDDELLLLFGKIRKCDARNGDKIIHMVDVYDADDIPLLIKHGASVNAKNGDGATALHKASGQDYSEWLDYEEKLETVRVLLLNGADVNAKDQAGDTALHTAAQHGFVDTFKKLIEHGADVQE
jgi:ankyrin repeat protein